MHSKNECSSLDWIQQSQEKVKNIRTWLTPTLAGCLCEDLKKNSWIWLVKTKSFSTNTTEIEKINIKNIFYINKYQKLTFYQWIFRNWSWKYSRANSSSNEPLSDRWVFSSTFIVLSYGCCVKIFHRNFTGLKKSQSISEKLLGDAKVLLFYFILTSTLSSFEILIGVILFIKVRLFSKHFQISGLFEFCGWT